MNVEFRLTSREKDLDSFVRWVHHPDVLINTPVSGSREISWWADYLFSYIKFNASLTACIDGVPVGVATLLLLPYLKLSHHAPIVLVVDPSQWRNGIGSALLKELEGLARGRFSLKLISIETTEPSILIDFCKKNGFSEFSRFENWFDVKGKAYPKLSFEKEL